MKPKNKNGKNDESHFLDGIDPHDQIGNYNALMGLFAKKGMKVTHVGPSGLEMALHSADGDAPPPSSGNREVDNLLQKIHELTKPSGVSKEAASPPKNNNKRKKGNSAVRFYWQYIEQDSPIPAFSITPKDFFDANGCLSDEHFDEEEIPEGFENVMESTFEFDGTRQQAEALLRANPLFEEKDMV
jgi:hypothetical protein